MEANWKEFKRERREEFVTVSSEGKEGGGKENPERYIAVKKMPD